MKDFFPSFDELAYGRQREMAQAVTAKRLLARDNFLDFMELFSPGFSMNWHIKEMCDWAEKLEYAATHPHLRSLPRNLIVTMPPRHTKSQTYSKALPIWFLGRNPDKEVVVGTYGSHLAESHGLWALDAMKTPQFQAIFPECKLNSSRQSREHIGSTRGGGIRFAGRGTSATGLGGSLLVVDDPYKDGAEADSEAVNEEVWNWFWEVINTRRAPGACSIVMHTRWRVNDLIGRLRVQDLERPPGKRRYHILDYPAIATKDEEHRKAGQALHPARYDERELEEMASVMPERTWMAMYQQTPVLDGGNFFNIDDLQPHFYQPHKAPAPGQMYHYLCTDFAMTEKQENDRTCLWPVGIDADRNQYFHPDFVLGHLDFGVAVAEAYRLACDYNVMGIFVETGPIFYAVQTMLTELMRRKGRYFNIIQPPAGSSSKRAKASPAQAMSKFGLLHFPDTPRFRTEALPEILAFDKAEHDDVVDTISIPSRCLEHQIIGAPAPSVPRLSDDEVRGSGVTLAGLEQAAASAHKRPATPFSLTAGGW